MLLAADKGNNRLEDMRGCKDPLISVHGSLSVMVNFPALQRWFQVFYGDSTATWGHIRGGAAPPPVDAPLQAVGEASMVLHSPQRSSPLDIFFAVGACREPCRGAAQTFRQSLCGHGVNDFFSLRDHLEAAEAPLGAPGAFLSLLRLGAWDPDILAQLSPDKVRAIASQLSPEDKEALRAGREAMEDLYVPFFDHGDIARGAMDTLRTAIGET